MDPQPRGLIQRLSALLRRRRRPAQLSQEQKDEQLARCNEAYRARTGRSLTQFQIQYLEQLQDADV